MRGKPAARRRWAMPEPMMPVPRKAMAVDIGTSRERMAGLYGRDGGRGKGRSGRGNMGTGSALANFDQRAVPLTPEFADFPRAGGTGA